MLSRGASSLNAGRRVSTRSLATSFAELYRNSVGNALLDGDVVKGHIVGHRRPRSSSSRFHIVDFGLKAEAPFTARELPGSSAIGDDVAMSLLALEDDFNEPVFDYEGRTELPSLQAERLSLLTRVAGNDIRLVHGRFVSFKKGGASVKVLGTDAFVPRHHILAINSPILGSYAPFLVMSVSTNKRVDGKGALGLDINPVVSSYGGFLLCVANLVGIDDAWKQSGGGSAKERLAYLRLLTKLLSLKNSAVRKLLPRSGDSGNRQRPHRRWNHSRHRESGHGDAAWLNDLSHGDWASSGTYTDHTSKPDDTPRVWDRLRRPVTQKKSHRTQINNPFGGDRESKGLERNSRDPKPVDDV